MIRGEATKTHLLLTNDFPPKIGGIQSYLWELWSRFDPSSYAVLTASSHPEARRFDEEQARAGLQIKRVPQSFLLPTPALAKQVKELSKEIGAELVVIDPALPLGLLTSRIELPYAIVLHGAELAIPARVPLMKQVLAHLLAQAAIIIAAGRYVADEAAKLLDTSLSIKKPPIVSVPPGVDLEKFKPLSEADRLAAKKSFGFLPQDLLAISVSRLVRRKGMDTLVKASAMLSKKYPLLNVVIAGDGRDRMRIARLISATGAPVRILGEVAEEQLPLLYGSADLFIMDCRNRWGGWEQEGFGIVFLEAAACALPSIAGASGGASEAVIDGETGIVLAHPSDPFDLSRAMEWLITHPELRKEFGSAAFQRVQRFFGYDRLAHQLASALAEVA